MRLPLTLHPESRCDALSAIEVEVLADREAGMALRYLAHGDTAEVRFPPLSESRRADDLWNHSCFELFVQAPPSSAYCEFNFSPSTEWAAYRFEGYRSGMSILSIEPPEIGSSSGPSRYELSVRLKHGRIGGTPDHGWRIGLAAVIEERCGRLSYWALGHPPGKPDFHHRDCFAAELPAPSAS